MTMLRASVDLLRQVPIFGSLTQDELQRIVDATDNGIVSYEPSALIMAENEIGDSMYIVLDGTVDVRITAVDGREITIATLKAGEFFGEQALLPGAAGRRKPGEQLSRPSSPGRCSPSRPLPAPAPPGHGSTRGGATCRVPDSAFEGS